MVDRVTTFRGSIYPTLTATKGREWGDVPTFHLPEGRPFTWGFNSYLTRFSSPSARSLGNTGSQPKCRALPMTYDDAGVTIPAGYVQVLAGIPLCRTDQASVTTFLNAGVTTRTAVRSWRHWEFPTILIGGIPAGTTGTITISRATDWQTGADVATLYTIPVDGANGLCQTFEIAELISAPANLPAFTTVGLPGCVIYVTASWTGTAPRTGILWHSPANLHTGTIVPTTLPGDFTARQISDWQWTYDYGLQYRPFKSPYGFIPGNWSPHWLQFTREYSTADSVQQLAGGNRPSRISMGFPDWMLESNNQGDADRAENESLSMMRPRAWIGNELKELSYWSRSHGTKAWMVLSETRTVFSNGVQGTYDSGWVTANIGPGWRNVRAQCSGDASDYPFITLDLLTVEWRMDGVSQGISDFTASAMAGLPGVQKDINNIYPAARTMASLLEYRVQVKGTAAGSGSIRINICLTMSPRIDIPIPTHTAGLGGIEGPGGYFPTGIIDPPALGGVLHCAAGVTSQAWSIVVGVGKVQWRLISFIPATTGLYKVLRAASSITMGMYEFGLNIQTNGLAQGGKRFYGSSVASDASGNVTYSLVAIAMTPKTIATGGTAIADADLSPVNDGYLFGQIAIPSAGRWRIWGRWIAGSGYETDTVEMAVSLTDPYCIDTITDIARVIPWFPTDSIPVLTSASTPPGAPANGTLRLITATATGVWAGHEGNIARYDENVGWQMFKLESTDRTFATIDGLASYWNGTAWEDRSAMKNLQAYLITTGPQTVYVRANQFESDRCLTYGGARSPKATGATLTIGWEAA